jgi:hypothetical protein
MKKISAGNTYFLKRLLPVILFAVPVAMILLMLGTGASANRPIPLPALLAPCIVAVVGFFVIRQLVLDLADEVYDGGDFLLVKNRGQEERIPLSNIMNVSVSQQVNPPRITLRLVTPGKFGEEVAFVIKREFSLRPFARSKLADDLIVRVDRARLNRPR